MADQNNPIVWVEIPVVDMARAKGFYEHLLGAALDEQQMGPMTMAFFAHGGSEGYGCAGALVKGEGHAPSLTGSLAYIHTKDIEAALTRVAEKGGKTLLPKTSIGEHGFIALFQDSEGNRLGLHSM